MPDSKKTAKTSEPSEADLVRELERAQKSGEGIHEASLTLGEFRASAAADQEAKARKAAENKVHTGDE